MSKIIDNLKKKLIVSCQANETEPLHSPQAILCMAKACIENGANAIRLEGVQSIRNIKSFFDIPIIGLIKKDYDESEIYITPTKKEVRSLAVAGADIIAIDATNRIRPNDEKISDLVSLIKNEYGLLAMADIASFNEGINASKLGFDLIGTTLSGYTKDTKKSNKPDFKLLKQLVNNTETPIIMEGRIWDKDQLKEAFLLGAHSVVIGSAITRPQLITKKFFEAIN